MNVGAFVTLIATVHHFYMRGARYTLHMTPILYPHRFVDHRTSAGMPSRGRGGCGNRPLWTRWVWAGAG